MEPAEAATQTTALRTEREDFQATSDPALQEAADRTSEVKLLDYRELYSLWERQQWATQDLDFSRDREDWNQRFDDEERYQRMYGLSCFFIGEQRVAEELGPIMRAAPTEDQRIFLCTQIADEARHVRFFERFYGEVGVLEADGLTEMLEETSEHLNENFGRLFDEMLGRRTERLSAEPEDTEALVEAITLYHMGIEGMLALTGQHFIMDYNEREGTLPGFVQGFQKVARDEHRHVAFGSVFLREKAGEDDRYKQAIQRTLEESLPVADKVLSPPWAPEDDDFELFGYSLEETRQFAGTCLMRRLKVIGLGERPLRDFDDRGFPGGGFDRRYRDFADVGWFGRRRGRRTAFGRGGRLARRRRRGDDNDPGAAVGAGDLFRGLGGADCFGFGISDSDFAFGCRLVGGFFVAGGGRRRRRGSFGCFRRRGRQRGVFDRFRLLYRGGDGWSGDDLG